MISFITLQSTLRNGYFQSSNYDRNVLTHHSDIEHRLRDYEYYPWLRGYPEPLRHLRCNNRILFIHLYFFCYSIDRSTETPTDRLISAKHENQRLQNELGNMERKFQKLDSRNI